MTEAPFHFTYTMSRPDYRALSRALSRVSLVTYAIRVVIAAAIAVGLFMMASGHETPHVVDRLLSGQADSQVYIELAIYVLIMAGAVTVVPRLLLFGAVNRVYARNNAADKLITFDATEQSITGGVQGVSTTVQWLAVQKLIETPEHLFIAISRREALIVPRRAFVSAAAFGDFANWVRDRVAAKRPASAG